MIVSGLAGLLGCCERLSAETRPWKQYGLCGFVHLGLWQHWATPIVAEGYSRAGVYGTLGAIAAARRPGCSRRSAGRMKTTAASSSRPAYFYCAGRASQLLEDEWPQSEPTSDSCEVRARRIHTQGGERALRPLSGDERDRALGFPKGASVAAAFVDDVDPGLEYRRWQVTGNAFSPVIIGQLLQPLFDAALSGATVPLSVRFPHYSSRDDVFLALKSESSN